MAVRLTVEVWQEGDTLSLVAAGESARQGQAPDLIVTIPKGTKGYAQVLALVRGASDPA